MHGAVVGNALSFASKRSEFGALVSKAVRAMNSEVRRRVARGIEESEEEEEEGGG